MYSLSKHWVGHQSQQCALYMILTGFMCLCVKQHFSVLSKFVCPDWLMSKHDVALLFSKSSLILISAIQRAPYIFITDNLYHSFMKREIWLDKQSCQVSLQIALCAIVWSPESLRSIMITRDTFRLVYWYFLFWLCDDCYRTSLYMVSVCICCFGAQGTILHTPPPFIFA